MPNYPVITKLKGAALIMESAAAEGLTEPWSVDTATFLPVTFIFRTPDDVTAWAAWAGATVVRRPALFADESVVHQFDAELYDVPFTCRCTAPQTTLQQLADAAVA
jgi:hypothetical protein